MRVLIIEDHEDVAANLGDFLESRGHAPDYALDGLGGLHLALTNTYDAIVLDIGLPGMDGLTLCRRLREDGDVDTPILMLTARDTVPDKLAGFDAGTDDYLVKPFDLAEAEARLIALTRRGRRGPQRLLRHGDLEVDTERFEVRRAGQPIELNRSAFTILRLLLEAAPSLVSREQIETALWGDDPPDSDALRSHIYTLRRAVDRPFTRPLILTVHGVGYKLAATDEAAE
jgi:DNA-binding response OmpR family regulator